MERPDFLNRKNINKNGGKYLNGKPLGLEMRREIIERWKAGEKVTRISVDLKITHGVVSKILKYYKRTGSYLPRKRSNPLTKKPPKETSMKFSVDEILKPSSPDAKRIRILFAPEKLKVLENYFSENSYLDSESKKQIEEKTKLSEKEISTWFSNKRSRLRKRICGNSSASSSSFLSADSGIVSQSLNSSTSTSESVMPVCSPKLSRKRNAVESDPTASPEFKSRKLSDSEQDKIRISSSPKMPSTNVSLPKPSTTSDVKNVSTDSHPIPSILPPTTTATTTYQNSYFPFPHGILPCSMPGIPLALSFSSNPNGMALSYFPPPPPTPSPFFGPMQQLQLHQQMYLFSNFVHQQASLFSFMRQSMPNIL